MEIAILITILIAIFFAIFIFGINVGVKVYIDKIYDVLNTTLKESNLTELEQMNILDKFANKLIEKS